MSRFLLVFFFVFFAFFVFRFFFFFKTSRGSTPCVETFLISYHVLTNGLGYLYWFLFHVGGYRLLFFLFELLLLLFYYFFFHFYSFMFLARPNLRTIPCYHTQLSTVPLV